jgi:sugar/nucleoside kinase (ribokinase family)
MYSDQDLAVVTVSTNRPDEKEGVLRLLQKKHATSRNLIFASNDTQEMQKAFDPTWDSAVPYTVLLSPDGKVLYKEIGSIDMLQVRRTILANIAWLYAGFTKYWQNK